MGERCKLPQWGLGRRPSRQTILCIFEPKSGALVAAVFDYFPENKCNFLRKNKLDNCNWVQFFRGSRRIAPWKSAPMV